MVQIRAFSRTADRRVGGFPEAAEGSQGRWPHGLGGAWLPGREQIRLRSPGQFGGRCEGGVTTLLDQVSINGII